MAPNPEKTEVKKKDKKKKKDKSHAGKDIIME
jgi:hypothetical protein